MKVSIIIDSEIRVKKDELPISVIDILKQHLMFSNPKYYENKERGYSTHGIPKTLKFLHEDNDYLTMSRGFTKQFMDILKDNSITYTLNDQSRVMPEITINFKGKLHKYQKTAIAAILKNEYGVLQAPPGSGKTVIALNAVAMRKQPTLVVVHSKELLHQWKQKAIEFLDISESEIGLIGDGNKSVGSKLTIAIINSLYKCSHEVKDHIGFLIVDECHRIPAKTFTEAISIFDSKYMLGLSATPYRRDKLTKVIYLHLGDKIFEIDQKSLQSQNKIMTATLKVRETDFDYDYSDDYSNMITELTENKSRNDLIVQDVIKQINDDGNGIALVISERKDHCYDLYEKLYKSGAGVKLLTGEVKKTERSKIIDGLNNNGKTKVLVATSQLIGEGFDLKKLSSLFITTPVKFSGRIIQYVGRILRTDSGKDKAIIYDYVDVNGVLQASFKSRQYAYSEMGVKM